jgi:hypothetical protein
LPAPIPRARSTHDLLPYGFHASFAPASSARIASTCRLPAALQCRVAQKTARPSSRSSEMSMNPAVRSQLRRSSALPVLPKSSLRSSSRWRRLPWRGRCCRASARRVAGSAQSPQAVLGAREAVQTAVAEAQVGNCVRKFQPVHVALDQLHVCVRVQRSPASRLLPRRHAWGWLALGSISRRTEILADKILSSPGLFVELPSCNRQRRKAEIRPGQRRTVLAPYTRRVP